MSNPIKLNMQADESLTDFAMVTLTDRDDSGDSRYLTKDEQSPQEAFARAAWAFAYGDVDFAQRIYEYASLGWFMFASPILSNGGTLKGQPISCFLNYVPDSIEGILDHYVENAYMSSAGGGIGGCWSDVRSNGAKITTGGKSTGATPFIHVVDSLMLAFSQRGTRRGSYAAYMDISHPEIEEFINMRKTTGDLNRKSPNLHHGVNIPDAFMEAVASNQEWPLVDPKTQRIVKKVSARELWKNYITTRLTFGEPYAHFIDTSNRFLPHPQKKLGLKIRQSNLCSEIILPTDENRSAVCCLSSVNLEKYDEWKDNGLFIEDLVRFLDNVLESFITNAPNTIRKAKFSAKQERSIGLGAMGFHAYLQSKGIPFAGPIASGINRTMFAHIQDKAKAASVKLASERGLPPDASGSDSWFLRNMHLMAIAPNATSSIILGTSPSIEPYQANVYIHDTLSGSFPVRNVHLEKRLTQLGLNTPEIWKSISAHAGSVQHLELLSDWDKAVFKTARELDQQWIIEHAAARQPFIDQAQSLNLFFEGQPDIVKGEYLHRLAWEKGLKTMYYGRSKSAKRAENLAKPIERVIRPDAEEDCFSCQG